jgi:hypothetical protein
VKAYEALFYLQHWPRYTSKSKKPWRPNSRGKYLLVDFQRLPENIEKIVHKINKKGLFSEYRCMYLDVTKADLWCLQSRVQHRGLVYFLKNLSRAQRWKHDRLPVVFQYRNKTILWNGHHRMLAARMLRRPLRCMVYRIGKSKT